MPGKEGSALTGQNTQKEGRKEGRKEGAAVHVPDFDTLVPAPELSLADAKKICPLKI